MVFVVSRNADLLYLTGVIFKYSSQGFRGFKYEKKRTTAFVNNPLPALRKDWSGILRVDPQCESVHGMMACDDGACDQSTLKRANVRVGTIVKPWWQLPP